MLFFMFLPMVSLTFLIAIFYCFADTGVLFSCGQWFVALGTFSGGVGGGGGSGGGSGGGVRWGSSRNSGCNFFLFVVFRFVFFHTF